MLLAYDYAQLPGYEARCVTFGAPRLGDADFVECFMAVVPHMARFLNKLDPVPRTPANSSDPNDDGPHAAQMLAATLEKHQVAAGISGYHHVCPGYKLDPETSRTAY